MQRTPDQITRLAEQALAERTSGVIDANDDAAHSLLEGVEGALRWALGADADADLANLVARMREANPEPEDALAELEEWARKDDDPASGRFFSFSSYGGHDRKWEATVFLDSTDRHPRAEGTKKDGTDGYVQVDSDTYTGALSGAVQVIREIEVVEQ